MLRQFLSFSYFLQLINYSIVIQFPCSFPSLLTPENISRMSLLPFPAVSCEDDFLVLFLFSKEAMGCRGNVKNQCFPLAFHLQAQYKYCEPMIGSVLSIINVDRVFIMTSHLIYSLFTYYQFIYIQIILILHAHHFSIEEQKFTMRFMIIVHSTQSFVKGIAIQK